ncbi:hypothetical protein HPB48_023255 [Haemaphysalis longicornis]|uniref:YqaJ viral recombinase domain-containing protein n=1 Tax=Haemaphysalis longicornis TaxID=44386 RepID=A0A9J6H5V7_HAELO|nr:hypothetical protein HPB48_023255 [Haemaphysalis longicornis]
MSALPAEGAHRHGPVCPPLFFFATESVCPNEDRARSEFTRPRVKSVCPNEDRARSEFTRPRVSAPSPPAIDRITEVRPPKTRKGAICDILKLAEQAGNQLSRQHVFEMLCKQYSADNIQAIERITTGESQNKCWFDHRIGMNTASVVHNVYPRVHTIQTKMGPHDVRAFLKLVMRESKVTTTDMRRGVELEGAAKSAYLSQNKKHNNLLIHDRGVCVLQHRPFLVPSPDGAGSCACCPASLIEVICPKSLVCYGSDPMLLKEKSRYFS